MDEQTIREAIERKRDGEPLDARTWHDLLEAYMAGNAGDAQMAALAMACVWRGLDLDETVALTAAMVESGAVLEYPAGTLVIDKHSSGGVSDIVSLVAIPLVAACGVKVAKLSGRALGHTGGTIDKLEALPGLITAMPMERFIEQVQSAGCAIAAQTDAIVPADKRLYHLRDRTGTVPSIGLISSSIVSKKIAGGAAAFVFDVKCGSAAFMQDPRQAEELAQRLVDVAWRFGRRARALVTDMNEPLGRSIGSGIELIEARDVLRRGHGDERTIEGCLVVAAAMLELAQVDGARARAEDALRSGAAYEKFVAMIEAQGSSREALDALAPSRIEGEALSPGDGFIAAIDARMLGNAARLQWRDDPTAGIRVNVRVGERVQRGTLLCTLHGSGAKHHEIASAFTIGSEPPRPRPLVYATI